MALSYAGIGLTVPTPDALAWVEQNISVADLFPWAENRLGPRRLAWTYFGQMLRRPVKLGTLWWPTGASRWAVGYFLASTEQLAQIDQKVYGQAGYQAQPLVLADNERKIQASMWMLPPRPLTQIPGQEGLWLVPLVDQRYWWWFNAGIAIGTSTQTYSSLIQAIGQALGITINTDYIPGPYVNASESLSSYYEDLPLLLDTVAWNIGQRVVVSWNGSVYLQNVQNARLQVAAQLAQQRPVLAGGQLDLQSYQNAPYNNDFPGVLPASIQVVFPRVDNNAPSSPPTPITVSFKALNLPDLINVKTNATTKTLHETAAALYTNGSWTNQATLQSLATQLATDWYRWQAAWLDIVFTGIADWTPEGLSDSIEWTYRRDHVTTRVQRPPYNDVIEEAMHSPYVAGAAGGSGITYNFYNDTLNYSADTFNFTSDTFNSTGNTWNISGDTWNIQNNTNWYFKTTTNVYVQNNNWYFQNTTWNVQNSYVWNITGQGTLEINTNVFLIYAPNVTFENTVTVNFYAPTWNFINNTTWNIESGYTWIINGVGILQISPTTFQISSTTLNIFAPTVSITNNPKWTFQSDTTVYFQGYLLNCGYWYWCYTTYTPTGDLTNYDPGTIPLVILQPPNPGPTFIRGLKPPPVPPGVVGNKPGRIIRLINGGPGPGFITHKDPAAIANGGIITPSGQTYPMPLNTGIDLQYDNSVNYWRIIGGTNTDVLQGIAVSSTTPTNGQVLTYNGSTQLWTPADSGSSPSAPGAPTSLVATPGDTQVSLTWTAPTGSPAAASYNVYYSTNSGMTGATKAGNTTSTSYTVTGLTDGTLYYFGVKAVSSGGAEGVYSNIASATPSAPYLKDTFTDTNSTTLPSHHMDIGPSGANTVGWTDDIGSWSITNNMASVAVASGGWKYAQANAGHSDGTATVQITTPASGNFGPALLFRYQDSNNHWQVNIDTLSSYGIRERISGSYTLRASFAGTLQNGVTYTATVVLSGTSITADIGGSKITYTSSDYQTATKFGIADYIDGSVYTAASTFDNFIVKP